MKRTLLITMLLCIAFFGFSQKKMNFRNNLNEVSYKEQEIHEPMIQSKMDVKPAKTKVQEKSTNNKSIIVREIGGSANGFSILGNRRYLWVDNNLNAVAFFHRMLSSPGSGHVGYDYSTDGGQSFTNNVQIYNPTLNNGYNARYPQGGLYNPDGNTDPANAVFGYFAPTLDGSSGSGTWGGYAFGAQMFAGSGMATLHSTTSSGGFVQDVPDGYTITKQGLAIAVDIMEPDFIYSDNMIVTMGLFNPDIHDFEMQRELVEMPGGGLSITGVLARVPDVKVAFSPDGNVGYIAYLSNNGGNNDNSVGCYYPILYKTYDAGLSWDGPYNVQLGGDDGIPAILNFLTDDIISALFEAPVPEREDIPFTTAFELDMTVDNFGNPHLIFNVGVGNQEFSLFTSYGGSIGCDGSVAMVHVYSTNGGESWMGDTLCTVKTFRGNFPYTGGDPIRVDNRPYVSSTMDGSKLFFSWIDTDFDQFDENTRPDIYCIGYDAVNNTYSVKNNVTFLTNAMWQAYMACGSKYVFDHNNGTYTIPFVYQEINAGDLINPVQYYYIDNFVLTDADLSVITGIEKPQLVSHVVSSNYPNPCSDFTRLNLQLDRSSSVNYNITNLLGQVVWGDHQLKLDQGNHVLTLDVSDLKYGVYFYNVNIDGTIHTGKMLVK